MTSSYVQIVILRPGMSIFTGVRSQIVTRGKLSQPDIESSSFLVGGVEQRRDRSRLLPVLMIWMVKWSWSSWTLNVALVRRKGWRGRP